MKILWGPLPPDAEVNEPHEILGFGLGGLTYQTGESWAELFKRLPVGFTPDVVVWRFPDSHPWPIHERCPVPLVGILGDWNLYFSSFRHVLDTCDYILTDQPGVKHLQSLGIRHVGYWPGYGFCPKLFHPRPDKPLLYDISFVGNQNHDIHRVRAKFLARMAKFSDRYRVTIRSEIWGDDYAEILARTRIVVNHSVRREMNLRAYEATASGALLFMEESNLEVREFLTDKKECVLYREDNFEDLLNVYLENEPLRAEIAEAGCRRIQSETYFAHQAKLIELLEKIDWTQRRQRPQSWPCLNEAERYYFNGRWLAFAGPRIHLGHEEFVKAVKADPTEPEHMNAVAVVEAVAAAKITDAEQRVKVFSALAESHWIKLVEFWPTHLLGWANLGLARLEFGLRETAITALTKALELLCSNTDQIIFREGCYFFVDSSLPIKTDFNVFRVEWESIVSTYGHDPIKLTCQLAILLNWQCARRLGDAFLASNQIDPAKDMYARAITARPDLEYAYLGLAHALERKGEVALACAAYREAIDRQPWEFPARQKLATLLNSIGDQFGSAMASNELSLLSKALNPQ